MLNVAQVPAELAGRNAAVVRRGAEALGWSGDFLYRNVRGCVGSGVCAFGCPTGAKQHTGITYVPRAWAAGATTYTGARAERIELRGGRAREVVARTRGGGRVRVRVRARDRRLRDDPHAVAAAPAGARRPFGRAGAQPRDPPSHRRSRPVRRADRAVARGAAVLLRGRVRGRGPDVRGRGRAAGLPGDDPARDRERPPRADALGVADVAVRGDGVRHLARARARGARAPADPLRPQPARHRDLQARPRAADRPVLGGGRAGGAGPRGGGARAARRRLRAAARARACGPAISS